MHPVIKSTIYTFIAFALVVALSYMNRDRIHRHFAKIEKQDYRPLDN